jgi:hypothetical protein
VIALSACANLESTMGPLATPTPATSTAQQVANSDIDCPTATVRTGASAWQVSAGPGATNVRYQGSLGQIARECAVLGETMTVRVGVEGRILVGPKGGPGTVNVPLRIALVQEGPQPRPLWSKFYSVPVSVPPGASQAVFTQVEDDVTFPLPANRKLDNYVVYVGFDPQGAVAASKSEKKAGKSTPSPAASKPKPKPAPQAKKPAASPPATTQQPQFEPPPGNVFAPPPGQRS